MHLLRKLRFRLRALFRREQPDREMAGELRLLAYGSMTLAVVVGGGSLLLFAAFLVIGPFTVFRFGTTEPSVLAWDGFLSLLFFVQHSGMVRTTFRTRLAARVPEHFHPAIYAIASGIALTAVVLLWQTSPTVLFAIEGPFRALPRAFTVVALAGFVWGIRALRHFDTFGLAPIKARLRGRNLPAPRFAIGGPYLWVRHPLHACMLALIWSAPDVTADRLLFNVLWTAWIVVGACFEERDLVAGFGERYRRYQDTVPMLVPWRGPVGRRLGRGDSPITASAE